MLFNNETDFEEDGQDNIFYVDNVLPMIDKLIYDNTEEVRSACALIFHEVNSMSH